MKGKVGQRKVPAACIKLHGITEVRKYRTKLRGKSIKVDCWILNCIIHIFFCKAQTYVRGQISLGVSMRKHTRNTGLLMEM